MRIATVYDNRTLRPDLASAWGFSCLVDEDLLFDTGGDGHRLISNMEKMGINAEGIRTVVLSHPHGDHTGGLGGILNVNEGVTVYLPRSFPASFKAEVRANAHLVEVHEPVEIAEGIYTTGEIGGGIREQALVLKTAQGLVVITGCAHPGIVEMVRRSKQVGNDEVYLVLGGFHLGGVGKRGIESIIAGFRRLGVQKVAPCHCTGRLAMGLFSAEYGDDFIENGVGKVLEV